MSRYTFYPSLQRRTPGKGRPQISEKVILEDTELLAELCGANDYNLSVISDLLGTRVFSRGNELSVESEDAHIQQLFVSIINATTTAINDGLPATPDLIVALHAELTPMGNTRAQSSCEDFLESCIQIPPNGMKVYPRSKGQGLYLRGMATHDLIFSIGPAGTGKTYLAMAWAIKELLSKSRRKLVLTRPIVEAGESLGFLPGDLVQKINPYLRPLYDAMESLLPFEVIRKLEESRSIEVAPLAYMRGRSLSNCVVILDEAQNTTKEQMKMFLTRLGENTKAIVTGDITQIDLPKRIESGLVNALHILDGVEEIFVSKLDSRDVVRSSLVRKIIEAYENE